MEKQRKQISSVFVQCRQMWRRALETPVKIVLDSEKEAFRTRFVLYDSVKVPRRTGSGDQELLQAIANCEVVVRDTTVILRRKQDNPFYDKLIGKMEAALPGSTPQSISTPDTPRNTTLADGTTIPEDQVKSDAEASLERMLQALDNEMDNTDNGEGQ